MIIKTTKKSQAKYYLDKNGYYRFADSHLLVHIWAVKKKYGRKIKSNECVHHLDGNKTNNNPYNLIIISKEKHNKIHQSNLIFWDNWHGPEFLYPQ
jgi:hypothetical protein